jgi:hypothetical protein
VKGLLSKGWIESFGRSRSWLTPWYSRGSWNENKKKLTKTPSKQMESPDGVANRKRPDYAIELLSTWLWWSHVEAGSNTSTVALRVVGGDVRKPSTWGYNGATLFLGDINTETWPTRLVESQIWDSKYGHESRETRTRKWLRWPGPAAIVKDKSILSSEGRLHKVYNGKC